jgi:hypothetical protein
MDKYINKKKAIENMTWLGLGARIEYMNQEDKVHRKITKDAPIYFEYKSVKYIGYRVNGFIQLELA